MRCVFNTSLKIIEKLNKAVKLQVLFDGLHFFTHFDATKA